MKIIRAEHLGMCFGVKDAVALARETSKHGPLTILGDLVHNETVLAELRAKGVRVAQQPGDVGTRTVMITAHGASQSGQAGGRRVSSGHHRQTRSRGGARPDRGSGCI
jgi:4-hydroxy-3-methylbut-2-enyl diphosphate reductase